VLLFVYHAFVKHRCNKFWAKNKKNIENALFIPKIKFVNMIKDVTLFYFSVFVLNYRYFHDDCLTLKKK